MPPQFLDNRTTLPTRLDPPTWMGFEPSPGQYLQDAPTRLFNSQIQDQGLIDVSAMFSPGGVMGASRLGARALAPKIVAPSIDKFKNLFGVQSADNLLPNELLTSQPSRYTRNLPRVDLLPTSGNPIAPIRPSAFDKQANNLGGKLDRVPDQKTAYDNLMLRKPILDKEGFPKEYYHGSTNVFKEFGTSKVGKDDLINPQQDWGDWSWHSPSSSYVTPYSRNELGKEVANANTQKNFLMPKKMFDPSNEDDINIFARWLGKRDGGRSDQDFSEYFINGLQDRKSGWRTSESMLQKEFLEANGYDGQYIFHAGAKNTMIRNPNAIKNVNNRGTFDLSNDTMKSLIPGLGVIGVAGGNEYE